MGISEDTSKGIPHITFQKTYTAKSKDIEMSMTASVPVMTLFGGTHVIVTGSNWDENQVSVYAIESDSTVRRVFYDKKALPRGFFHHRSYGKSRNGK